MVTGHLGKGQHMAGGGGDGSGPGWGDGEVEGREKEGTAGIQIAEEFCPHRH